MKFYNKTTKELFNFISFISPFSIFKISKKDIKIVKMNNYVYFFPQKSSVWHSDNRTKFSIVYKHKTLLWFLCWHIIITHSRTPNHNFLPRTSK
jgi:hypothetical protein